MRAANRRLQLGIATLAAAAVAWGGWVYRKRTPNPRSAVTSESNSYVAPELCAELPRRHRGQLPEDRHGKIVLPVAD